jgi:multidrug resistance protein
MTSPAPMPTSRLRWTLILASVGAFMTSLDVVVVSTALPTLQKHFGASLSDLEWTINAYNLAFACLMLTGAALGDRFGRRLLYVLGLGLFTSSSIACALAGSAGTLIAARVFQGVGAAIVLPLTLTLISDAFPLEKRGAAIGIWGAITGLGVAAGPVLGGLLIKDIAWQWIFWINVPVGILSMVLCMVKLRESRGDRPQQRRARYPMLPLQYFRRRGFSTANGVAFFLAFSLIGSLFMIAQMFQTGLGYDPLQAGLRILVWTAMPMLVAPIAGALSDKIGNKPFMAAGLVLQGGGLLWLALEAKPAVGYGSLIGPLIVSGIGIAMVFPTVANAVVGSVPITDSGVAAGTNNTVRESGGVFGVAILAAVFAAHGGYSSPAAFMHGFRAAELVAAGAAIVGAAVATLAPSKGETIAAAAHEMPVVSARQPQEA